MTRTSIPAPAGGAAQIAFARFDAEAQGFILQMLRSQAFRERAAIRLFEEGARFAPDPAAQRGLAHDCAEEQRHYDDVAELWAACQGAPRSELDAWAAARVARDEVPLPSSWLDVALAQFLYDRAGLWQLREVTYLPFAPYAALARSIVADEDGHGQHGEAALATLRATASSPRWATAFHRWLRVALLSFGRPSSRAARAGALGLRRRSPAAVRDDFLADIAPAVGRLGFSWPEPTTLGLELPSDVFARFVPLR